MRCRRSLRVPKLTGALTKPISLTLLSWYTSVGPGEQLTKEYEQKHGRSIRGSDVAYRGSMIAWGYGKVVPNIHKAPEPLKKEGRRIFDSERARWSHTCAP